MDQSHCDLFDCSWKPMVAFSSRLRKWCWNREERSYDRNCSFLQWVLEWLLWNFVWVGLHLHVRRLWNLWRSDIWLFGPENDNCSLQHRLESLHSLLWNHPKFLGLLPNESSPGNLSSIHEPSGLLNDRRLLPADQENPCQFRVQHCNLLRRRHGLPQPGHHWE